MQSKEQLNKQKMNTRVISYVLFAVAIGLTFYLYRSVAGPMEEKERIEKAEKLVVQKLEVIREAQKAYMKRNGKYARKWENLASWIKNGEVYNIQVVERSLGVDPNKPWEGEQVEFTNDTLEAIPAKTFILAELNKNVPANPTKKIDAKRIGYKIGTEEKFKLYVDKIPLGGTEVEVIQVTDPNPIDKTRKEDHDLANRRPLKFGSKDEVSTGGSWQ